MAQENQRQLAALTGRVDQVAGRVTRIEGRMDQFDKRLNALGAMAAASTAATVGNLAPGETGVGVAVGSMRDEPAISFAVQRVSGTGNRSFKATISHSRAGVSVGAGVFFKL